MTHRKEFISFSSSVHLRGQLRAVPQDNFSSIAPDQPFCAIELWKQFEPQLKWRVEKPARVAVMDGEQTLLYIKTANVAVKVPQPSTSAFDTAWVQKIANLGENLEHEIENAQAQHWALSVKEERGTDGRAKAVVTVETKAGLPENDYLKNRSFERADTRRVYRFDDASGLLEAVQVYLLGASGEKLVFELSQIEYNQPIDASVFTYELPANVNWYREMEKLPDNEKYAAMTAEQAARAYFEAFAQQDWAEAEKFRQTQVDEGTRQVVAGLEIISIGKEFHSADKQYPGVFVPYELKLKRGEVVKHNIALKKDGNTGRWFVDGGGF